MTCGICWEEHSPDCLTKLNNVEKADVAKIIVDVSKKYVGPSKDFIKQVEMNYESSLKDILSKWDK